MLSELEVTQNQWDSLSVSSTFQQRKALGGYEAVEAPEIHVRLYDSKFDTLYSGSQTTFPVPDRELASQEKLLIELCATFEDGEVCEQRGLAASQKKYSVDQEIDYPSETGFDRGKFEASFRLDRIRFGTEEWEQIELPETFSRYLIASIDSSDGGSIQVPLRRMSGRFDLSSFDNYRDFKYYLLSNLLDYNSATIRFDIYAANRGETVILASETRTVKTKSRQTRELEAGMFMQEASRRVLTNLRTFPIGTEEYAYLDSWNFVKVTNRYVIEMDLSWRSRFIRERWYSLQGVLEVNEDGSDPTFKIQRGNSRAIRRWRDRFSSESINLGPLGVKSTESESEAPRGTGSPRDSNQ